MNVFDYTPVWTSSYYVTKRQSNFIVILISFCKVEITSIGTNASYVKTRYRKTGGTKLE